MKLSQKIVINQQQIIDFIQAQGRYVLKREIARVFQFKAQEKQKLKDLLNWLEVQKILKRKGKSYCYANSQTDIIVKIIDVNAKGGVTGEITDSYPHSIPQTNTLRGRPNFQASLNVGDYVIVNIDSSPGHAHVWKFVRKLSDQPTQIFGFVKIIGLNKFVLEPIDRKVKGPYPLTCADLSNLQDHTLIEARLIKNGSGQLIAQAIKLLHHQPQYVRQLSLIAIHKYDLPHEFSAEALSLAEKCQLPPLKDRVDLRDLPLVTIDDQSARDHDDAVYCESMNNGQWRLIVAIADVSYFVHPKDALDHDALMRANSVYFPDQVLPMLPEQLSASLCSLKPQVDRPCLVADMVIGSNGRLNNYKFYQAMMRSHGKLTYSSVQNTIDGDLSQLPENLSPKVIENLNHVYHVLKAARRKRGSLDLDIPEKKIELDDQGRIKSVLRRQRFESNQMIEEMMIIANVAAAQFLSHQSIPPLYRIHDQPRPEGLTDLRHYLKSTSVSLPKGQALKPRNFMTILDKVKELPQGPAINELILRAQSQAQYSPENIGHFGLNLTHYCHFTSPIRRYADLIVHRAIKAKINCDAKLFPYSYDQLEAIGQEISDKERRAAKAERDTLERYVAHYLNNRVGENMVVHVNGFTSFAVFVTHIETGAEGILPLRNIRGDYFTYYPQEQMIVGRRSHIKIELGNEINVVLECTNYLNGSIVFACDVLIKKPKNRR